MDFRRAISEDFLDILVDFTINQGAVFNGKVNKDLL